MGDQQELEKLTKQLDASLNRIDRLQKGQTAVPAGRRLHRMAKSPSVWGAVMSGILFTVVLNRLSDKREYQVRQRAWTAAAELLLAVLLLDCPPSGLPPRRKNALHWTKRKRACVRRLAGVLQPGV